MDELTRQGEMLRWMVTLALEGAGTIEFGPDGVVVNGDRVILPYYSDLPFTTVDCWTMMRAMVDRGPATSKESQ